VLCAWTTPKPPGAPTTYIQRAGRHLRTILKPVQVKSLFVTSDATITDHPNWIPTMQYNQEWAIL
jgi:superfamily II DNA or RNA helicase